METNSVEATFGDVDCFLSTELDEFNQVFSKLTSLTPVTLTHRISEPEMENTSGDSGTLPSYGKDFKSGRKTFKDDSLMREMPSLGRYSSLPNRHFLKKKKGHPADPFGVGNSEHKTTVSCFEVGETSVDGFNNSNTSEENVEKTSADSTCATDAMCTDIVIVDDSYTNVQCAEEHYIDVGSVPDDAEQSSSAMDSDKTNCPDADDDNMDDAGAVDRTIVDEFVMSLVPSFGQYASLPPKAFFQATNYHSLCYPSKQTDNPIHAAFGPGKAEQGGYHGPVLDDIGLLKLSKASGGSAYQSRSSSCINTVQLPESRFAWLPIKSFDDSVKEYIADSAYQTSDSLKLHTFSLSKEELHNRIETINCNPDGVKIKLEPESDIYHGSIRVVIDLVRPIDVEASNRLPSECNICQASETKDDRNTSSSTSASTASTYISLNVSSETTADQVIKEILKGHNITNHLGRFALFEKINRNLVEGQTEDGSATVYLRKLSNKERPLELFLQSFDETVDSCEQRQFLLKENDRGEILWEAFSLPELNMFLDILLREEEMYIQAIRNKYATLRTAIEQKLDAERLQNYNLLTVLCSPTHTPSSQGNPSISE